MRFDDSDNSGDDVELFTDEDVPKTKFIGCRRSATLGDFFAPGLLSKDDPDDAIVSNDEEEEFFEEEEVFEDSIDDNEIITECLTKIQEKWEYNKNKEDDIIHSLRQLDYDIESFLRLAKKGHFGTFKAKVKRSLTSPSNIQPKTPPPRSFSVRNLKDIGSMNHKTNKVSIEEVLSHVASQKKHLNLVIVGHVDAGKSTLIGHILLKSGNVSRSEMYQIEKESQNIGRSQDQLSWIMSEDATERSRGVTIDVAMTDFETNKLSITVLDAPGHRDFVPNMIAGASQADCALLVVDVMTPNIEKGQAGEHLLLCRSLGVQSLIVAINKMDSVSYDEAAYKDVKDTLGKFLQTLGWNSQHYIPTSATVEDDLLTPSINMPWYNGPSILEAIDSISPPKYDIESQLLICVSESVETGNKEITAIGHIDSGYICVGDDVKVLPANSVCKVNSILLGNKSVPYAYAGHIAEIAFYTSIPIESFMVGSAICDVTRDIPISNQFLARVITFQTTVPLLKGASLVFHRHAVDIPLDIEYLKSLINKKTKEITKIRPQYVPMNSLADIVFRLDQPLAIELHSLSKTFGRFIIRARGETLGFGSITSVFVYVVDESLKIRKLTTNTCVEIPEFNVIKSKINADPSASEPKFPRDYVGYIIDSQFRLIRPKTFNFASKNEVSSLIQKIGY